MIPLRRISTAASGIGFSSSSLISSNDKYYLYGSHHSLYLYKIPEMEQVEFICQGNDLFELVRLSPSRHEIAFIMNHSKHMYFFNLLTHKITDYIGKIEYPIAEIQFSYDGSQIIILCAEVSIFHIVDANNLNSSIVSVEAGVPRMFVPIPRTADQILYSADNKEIDIINLSTSEVFHTKVRATPYCMKFDPLNSSNCFILTRSKKWGYVIIGQSARLITVSDRRKIRSTAGDWIPCMPGHVVTGDSEHGILYFWSVSSGEIVDTVTIGDGAGITNITLISHKDLVIAFTDGSIGVYDAVSKEYKQKVPRAHTNTIFSGAFLPSDPSLIATASADGRVCFWRIPTLEQVQSVYLEENSHSLFCIAFSDGGGFVAVGNSTGHIVVYNVQNSKVVLDERIHKEPVLGVSWCPASNSLLASSSEDHTCLIYDTSKRQVLTKILINSKLRRCRWSHQGDKIGIACANGSVYVRHDGGAFKIIKASNEKIFDVAWSRHDKNRIAAVDDEGAVILMNIEEGSKIVAKEHQGPARAIEFLASDENILMTGGYDGCVIFWDGNTLAILRKFVCHSSHIYGIFCHPHYPNLIGTVSKDCTVRLWSVDQIFPKSKLKAILNEEKYIASKFSPLEGYDILEKLIKRISRDKEKINFKATDILHVNDILRIHKKRVNKIVQTLPNQLSEMQRLKSAKKLALDAAEISLKIGNIKRYCELMFVCGEFDAALSVAPAVSSQFWRSLVLARAKMLEETEEGANLLIIAGNKEDAIECLAKQGLYSIAMLVAASTRETRNPASSIIFSNDEEKENKDFVVDSVDEISPELRRVSSMMTEKYSREGKPLLAAASLLSVGDADGAVMKLFMSGEIAWAFEISRAVDRRYDFLDEALFVTCASCGLGHDAFNMLSPSSKRKFAPFLAISSESELNDLYTKNGMKTVSQVLEQSRNAKGINLIRLRLISGDFNDAISLVVKQAQKILAEEVYDFSELEELSEIIKSAGRSVDPSSKQWCAVVAICHYVGLYKCLWAGLSPVAALIFDAFQDAAILSAEEFLTKRIQEAKVAALMALSISEKEMAHVFAQNHEMNEKDFVSSESATGGKTFSAASSGIIPIDIDKTLQYSICTGKPVKQNPFILENMRTRMTMNEALMYCSVTPFSPLKTMKYLIPF